jgi:hypothetical protein
MGEGIGGGTGYDVLKIMGLEASGFLIDSAHRGIVIPAISPSLTT